VKRILAVLALSAALASPAWAGSTIVPDPTITRGAVRTTDVGEICSSGTGQLRCLARICRCMVSLAKHGRHR
jgi:hypothetical protein